MKTQSRRDFALQGISLGIVIATMGAPVGVKAAAAPPLDPNDATAKALAFVSDVKQVKADQNPTFKPGQKCANCAQYQGKANDASAPCTIFAGKTVPADGWCKVWVARPA